jgi:hypothetical protein
MKYLLLMTNGSEEIAEWQRLSEEEQQRLRAEELPKWGELFGWIEQKGLKVDGLELDDPSRARTIRVRNGETLVTDGPYAETKDQIGGFFVAECDDLDDAIELASRVPVASKASVEIRPLVPQ